MRVEHLAVEMKSSSLGQPSHGRTLFWAVVILGIVLRLLSIAVAGNHLMTPWSGGGDQREYITLPRICSRGMDSPTIISQQHFGPHCILYC
jgi:hypothetical protein